MALFFAVFKELSDLLTYNYNVQNVFVGQHFLHIFLKIKKSLLRKTFEMQQGSNELEEICVLRTKICDKLKSK